MKRNNSFSRRKFLEYGSLGLAGVLSSPGSLSGKNRQDAFLFPDHNLHTMALQEDINLIGSYGRWAAQLMGDQPGRSSFRNSRFKDPGNWKRQALSRVRELLAPPAVTKVPEVNVLAEYSFDGLSIKKLRWQLPYGPATEAYYLRPLNVRGKLPGVLALHDHGGNKYFGKQKIVNISENKHPMLVDHQKEYYSGRAWANELAKKGYAVLVNDTFTFESRKVLLKDVPPVIRMGVSDVSEKEESKDIEAYNRWAANHEHILAKSLFSAGTTWPGVFLTDDQVALSVLSAQEEVDVGRLGCCGLSGGGLRTVVLGGMDQRIKAAVCVGMMSTWRDLILYHSFTHTWMMFMPLMPEEMDYSELFALQLPAPRMVLNNIEDGLFNINEMRRADGFLKEVYQKAGVPQNYTAEFYPGIHKFDLKMQQSAFAWMDKWLK